jgi:hypothetical protein
VMFRTPIHDVAPPDAVRPSGRRGFNGGAVHAIGAEQFDKLDRQIRVGGDERSCVNPCSIGVAGSAARRADMDDVVRREKPVPAAAADCTRPAVGRNRLRFVWVIRIDHRVSPSIRRKAVLEESYRASGPIARAIGPLWDVVQRGR